jgi:filamentous hemagglutinin
VSYPTARNRSTACREAFPPFFVAPDLDCGFCADSLTQVQAFSGRDITVQGATIVSDNDLLLDAGRNLTIESAQSAQQSASAQSSSENGMVGSWYNPSFGIVQGSSTQSAPSTVQVASQVASLQGNVTLIAGQTYRQSASSVMALGQAGTDVGGDVNILAKRVQIESADNTGQTADQGHSSSTVVGGSLSVGGIQINADSLKNLGGFGSTLEAMGNTSDPRMLALGAATLAMSGSQLVNSATNLYNSAKQIAGTAGQAAAGQIISNGAQALGFKVSVNLSHSQSQYQSSSDSTQAVGSSIVGAGNVNITATGAGADSNIAVIGSTLSAGKDLDLSADNKVQLLASQNSFSEQGSSSASGINVGVGFSVGAQNGFTGELSASQSKGSGNQNDVSYNNTQVSAGQTVNIVSGGDLDLKGAVVAANRIKADVGGNLDLLTVILRVAAKQRLNTSATRLQPASGMSAFNRTSSRTTQSDLR